MKNSLVNGGAYWGGACWGEVYLPQCDEGRCPSNSLGYFTIWKFR